MTNDWREILGAKSIIRRGLNRVSVRDTIHLVLGAGADEQQIFSDLLEMEHEALKHIKKG